MSNYDDILREKENDDLFNDQMMESHWGKLQQTMNEETKRPKAWYRVSIRYGMGVAAALVFILFGYIFFRKTKADIHKVVDNTATLVTSVIAPPLASINVPYEIYSFDATIGDTIFTLNGSIIIFPPNALLNSNGDIVNGRIELRTREFNDPFDYSVAGIPMTYDSAGKKYDFISSAMIDIQAYQNGDLLKVNPKAKPRLNLVSTNKETTTNLYQLDTTTGKWLFKGKDEVIRLNTLQKNKDRINKLNKVTTTSESKIAADFYEDEQIVKPIAPQKASADNPVINITIDPASFKELLVYDGLKFEVLNAGADIVGTDAKTEWENVVLKRGSKDNSYIVTFSAAAKKVTYDVRPVLEGKDFEAAEKLYQEKLRDYNEALAARTKKEQEEIETFKQKNPGGKVFKLEDSAALKAFKEENKRMEELNRLVLLRNKFIEIENKKIEEANKANKRLADSIINANQVLLEEKRKQQADWEKYNRTAALEQYLVRSFEIDGFGYWNCDQPSSPQLEQWVSYFKDEKGQPIVYTQICIAAVGINRIQNYYQRNVIGLVANTAHFGWAFNANQFYYFTKNDFDKAVKSSNPRSIAISMHTYEGEAKSYSQLKKFLFDVNNNNTDD